MPKEAGHVNFHVLLLWTKHTFYFLKRSPTDMFLLILERERHDVRDSDPLPPELALAGGWTRSLLGAGEGVPTTGPPAGARLPLCSSLALFPSST